MENSLYLYSTIAFLPLVSAILVGLLGKQIGRANAHRITISAVGASFLLSAWVFWSFLQGNFQAFEATLYTWGVSGTVHFQVGFLIDTLTAVMMLVVSFVSFMVHIYTIGYMSEDPGYQRFFSYISLFTFAMFMLVMSNNFLQLFFGWEAVGLVSYLLIGFWYTKETAIFANMKAFLVNRVGDFGFLIGIAAVLYYFGNLDYLTIFQQVDKVASAGHITSIGGVEVDAMTLICIGLFIGAMGKSAQVPLHVWLPDSMEGPTPISALIHAATMVTAGVFMIARMSPLFEYSDIALNVILTVGAVTALFMGFVGVVNHDIKRIVAYSTLSQLGYMMVAMGASAYSIGVFHLMTHAFFKALLFLGAGSCIMAMHHEQDIRKMGNLRKYMPITYGTMLIGSLAIIGFPLFSGFYSKDLIIDAVRHSHLAMSDFAYFAVIVGVFVTALYSFRLFFLVFHTSERMDLHTRDHLHESPWVVWLPLVLLAIPACLSGLLFMKPLMNNFFGEAIVVHPAHQTLAAFKESYQGAGHMALMGVTHLPFWLALLGVVTAWLCFVKYPNIAKTMKSKMRWVHVILMNKYGFDDFNQTVIASGTQGTGWFLWRLGDKWLIDGLLVNGTAKSVGFISSIVRKVQTGYLYHYAFSMIAGFLVFIVWLLLS